MSGLSFRDAVNQPATGATGDDRYGFDESAGTAWVIDGATDVGEARLIPDMIPDARDRPVMFESDAAWYAETLSERFMQPPAPGETPKTYFARAIADMAASLDAIALRPVAGEPRWNLPSAGGIWMRRDGDALDFAALGDCLALVETGGRVQLIGDLDGVKDEHVRSRAVLAQPAGKAGGFAAARAERGRINTPGGATVFSIHPEAAEHASVTRIPVRGETNILLMSDGFFRLVEPYGLYDAAGLMAAVKAADDLMPLVRDLRRAERDPADDVRLGRLKTKDDACALWLTL